jgi:hypothetical protein
VTSDEGLNGGFQLETADRVDQVVAFYRGRLGDTGFETRVNEFSGGDGESGAVVYGEKKSTGRSVTIMVRQDEEGLTRIAVSYQQRNEQE